MSFYISIISAIVSAINFHWQYTTIFIHILTLGEMIYLDKHLP
jgi:hypothetical protein